MFRIDTKFGIEKLKYKRIKRQKILLSFLGIAKY